MLHQYDPLLQSKPPGSAFQLLLQHPAYFRLFFLGWKWTPAWLGDVQSKWLPLHESARVEPRVDYCSAGQWWASFISSPPFLLVDPSLAPSLLTVASFFFLHTHLPLTILLTVASFCSHSYGHMSFSDVFLHPDFSSSFSPLYAVACIELKNYAQVLQQCVLGTFPTVL